MIHLTLKAAETAADYFASKSRFGLDSAIPNLDLVHESDSKSYMYDDIDAEGDCIYDIE